MQEELKKTYIQYSTLQDKEYLDGLKQLRTYYASADINFDNIMDTNEDENIIMVGVFIDEDIYGIASYNRETKKFTIDYQEVDNTIDIYRDSQEGQRDGGWGAPAHGW